MKKKEIMKKDDIQRDDSNVNTDVAITRPEQDELNFMRNVELLKDKIDKIQCEQTYSFGIVGQWGTGKTSFMNLLKYKLKEQPNKNRIIMNFNPRNSSRVECIQEDFLKVLCHELKKYHSGFSLLTSKYIKVLRINQYTNIIAQLYDIFSSTDLQSVRYEIEEAIKEIDRKIIVFIDDLDRLEKEEIIEVFKLIDCNASFPNFIFVTAYDKKYVDKLFCKCDDKNEVSYSDKYFNKELRLTIPRDMMGEFFKKLVTRDIQLGSILTKEILMSLRSVISENIACARDVKKFIDDLVDVEIERWQKVNVTELLLVMLLRFRYNQVYQSLMHRALLSVDQKGEHQEYVLKDSDELSKVIQLDKRAQDILCKLFCCKGEGMWPKSGNDISHVNAFGYYFVDSNVKNLDKLG